MADKKGGVATDDIMSPAEMKPLLMLSKHHPISAVVGMTKDHDGVILLSRRLKPKKLLAQLKADARKAKVDLDLTSLRFGKAEVDTDRDSGLVMFTVNKDTPGALRMKLLELVKRVPLAKVEIDVDAKIEDEPEDDDEQPGGSHDAPHAGASAGEMTLGPARIIEEGVGPPVGPGPGADTLYAFMAEDGSGRVDQKASPTAAALNEAGSPLQAEVAAILKHFMTWKHAVAVIQEDQKKGKGLAALQSVNDAAGAIGRAGSGMRDGTQKFYDTVKDAETVIDELAAQVDKFSGANHQFTALLWDDAAQKQARVVDNNKDAVNEEKEKIEEKKKQIEGYFSLAEKLLKPQEWSEAVLTVSLFVDEKLTSAIVASTDKLEDLKHHLEESKQELASLQDTAQAERILSAQKTASSEMHSLDAVWKKFDRLVKDVRAAQTTVLEELNKSPATKLAAQAVAQRDAISRQATNTASMVRSYLAEAEPLLKNILRLGERYRSYVSIVGQYGKGAPEYLDSLSKTAKRNTDACQEFADYIQVTQVQAREGLDYLTKDTDSTFLAGYNKIPDALEDAIIGRGTRKSRSQIQPR
jgi:hypothetical protein